jgi:hypothetical protein
MTLIIISGGIDLSVAANIALSTIVIARIMSAHGGHAPTLAAAAGVATSAFASLVVALMIVGLRLPPFIVTLGTWGSYRGVAKWVANNSYVYPSPVDNPDAWNDTWGFVAQTERELSKMAADLKLIAFPELSYITEIDGEPAAVALALPNLNELIKDLGGKLGPLGLPKLIWRLKVVGPHTARLVILGIRKKFRTQRKYAALSAYLYSKMNAVGKRLGLEGGELSWTLEDNGPVNTGIKLMGGKVYKTYRLYEKAL